MSALEISTPNSNNDNIRPDGEGTCLFACLLFAFSAPRPLDARVVDVDGPAQGPDSEARPVRPPAQRRDGVHVLHVADPSFFPGPRPRCM